VSGITERSLGTLELPAIRVLLAERSSYVPGRELAEHIAPTTDLKEATRLQDETAAARALTRAQPSAGIGGAKDIRDAIRRARLGGALDPDQLLGVADTIRAVARELFIPLAVGGGIRTEDDAAAAVDAGADKVSLNTAALSNPSLITTLANRYGSQAVIVAIDAKRAADRFAVYSRSGTTAVDRDAVEWAREAESSGAGEILLTSIDRDGTKAGFDCDLTAAVSNAVSIPVIASGGAGGLDDFVDVFTRGAADAALAASIFHYAETSVRALKQHLKHHGIPVRL